MNTINRSHKWKKKSFKWQLTDVFRTRTKAIVKPQDEVKQIDKFAEELSHQIVSFEKVQALAWHGVPCCIRPKIWKYLLKYVFINNSQQILTKKRSEYSKLLENYWSPSDFSQQQSKIAHTIEMDVKRIGVEYNAICKTPQIQQRTKRLLYIWHNRHPASGYVQGMCDICIPFLMVFLGEYLPYDQQKISFKYDLNLVSQDTLLAVEADMYWCISKMMESVTSNYTQGFDGLKMAYSKVEQYLFKIDEELFEHFKRQKIDLFAVSFRNISTMLLRCFNPNVGIRLFDTFISIESNYSEFMVFVFIAVIEKFAKKLLAMKFQDLMAMLQNLPTKQWKDSDLDMIIAEAYVYQKNYFEDNKKQDSKKQQ